MMGSPESFTILNLFGNFLRMSNSSRYWGEATSLINWCELDYVTENHIAEYWNTISNIFHIWFGINALRLCKKHSLPFSLKLSSYSQILTGIMSGLFHATLKYETQKLDEIFETLIIIGIFHSFNSNNNILILHCITSIIGILFIQKWFAEIHLIIISLLTIQQLFTYFDYIINNYNLKFKLFIKLILYLIIACISWLIDRIFCQYLNNKLIFNPQFHAFGWHIFTALTVNQLIIIASIMNFSEKNDEIYNKSKTINLKYFTFIEIDFSVKKIKKD